MRNSKGNRPNILLIIIDDPGITDISTYGPGKVSIPNFDAITSQLDIDLPDDRIYDGVDRFEFIEGKRAGQIPIHIFTGTGGIQKPSDRLILSFSSIPDLAAPCSSAGVEIIISSTNCTPNGGIFPRN